VLKAMERKFSLIPRHCLARRGRWAKKACGMTTSHVASQPEAVPRFCWEPGEEGAGERVVEVAALAVPRRSA
jgi:hypothetical protein